MDITLLQAADFLLKADRILLLTHQSPDGDTLGSAGALCLALQSLGKQVCFRCADPIPEKFMPMLADIPLQQFQVQTVVAVDVADRRLLGALSDTVDAIDLCIDHHHSNTRYAQRTFVSAAAANTENIAQLLELMHIPLTPDMARCLYTGLITDTGCFRYSCVTPQTMRIAATLMEHCPDTAAINLKMFEIKSRSRLAIEQAAMDGMQFWADDRCALITVTQQMLRDTGASEGDLEGIAPIPRNVEGVEMGFLVREKKDGTFKVSCRTAETVDATVLCKRFDGGGHKRAAGFTFTGTYEALLAQLRAETTAMLAENTQ